MVWLASDRRAWHGWRAAPGAYSAASIQSEALGRGGCAGDAEGERVDLGALGDGHGHDVVGLSGRVDGVRAERDLGAGHRTYDHRQQGGIGRDNAGNVRAAGQVENAKIARSVRRRGGIGKRDGVGTGHDKAFLRCEGVVDITGQAAPMKFPTDPIHRVADGVTTPGDGVQQLAVTFSHSSDMHGFG